MPSATEKRTAQRIEIEVPVHLEHGFGVTRDVSLAGIYFITDQKLSAGTRIRFKMEFEFAIPGRPMALDCQAHVLRVEPHGKQMGIAAVIEDFTYLQQKREHAIRIAPGSDRLQ